MPYYDYKVVPITLNKGATEYMLCKLGEEGWELVTADFNSKIYIFKKVRYHKINEDNKTEDKDLNDQGQRT